MKRLTQLLLILTGTFGLVNIVEGDEVLENVSTDDLFQSFVTGLQSRFFDPILNIIKNFISSSKGLMLNIGSSLYDSIGLSPKDIFSPNFVFIFIGIIAGIMIMKYIITVAIEFISKLADPV
jgi:hypothetical protein